jgi:uncharacterized protein (TIGR01777 family)
LKIVIPGGSGQVGTILARSFQRQGHEVVVLSRKAAAAPWRVRGWDAHTVSDWARELEGADVVINLAGRNVNCRYTPANRREIMDSRVDSTRAVGAAIAQASAPPPVWLQMSTATIYAHRFDAPNDEAKGIIGGAEPDVPDTWRFSIDVARAWERAASDAVTPRTRKVLLRAAMVMSPDRGGIFDTLLELVRRGLGGPAAGGKQFVSWIHEVDFLHAIEWIIRRTEIDGPINIASPNPIPYAGFMRTLRRAAGVPIGLPATKWMLEIGTFLMRTESELVLKSRRVIPGRLTQMGFRFEYSDWSAAAPALVQRWREMRRSL